MANNGRYDGYEEERNEFGDIIYYTDLTTGEYKENRQVVVNMPEGSYVDVVTPEEQRKKRNRAQGLEQAYNTRLERSCMGSFIWVSKTHGFCNISCEILARFIMLCCYLDYDGILKNKVKRELTRADLPKILNISVAQVDRTIRVLIENGYISSDNKVYKIITPYIQRGSLNNVDHESFTRIYTGKYKKVYMQFTASKQKLLGYILYHLRYMNIKYNILTLDIDEQDIDDIQPISMEDFCYNVNYNYNTAFRLKQIYKNITLNGKPDAEPVLLIAKDNSAIAINPELIYGGSGGYANLKNELYNMFYG